jgi:hypothetical protein
MTLSDQAMMEKLCVGCIVNVATGKLFCMTLINGPVQVDQ